MGVAFLLPIFKEVLFIMSPLITIDGQDVASFGARLVSYNTGAPLVTNTYQEGASLFPVLLEHRVGLRSLTVVLEFSADSREEAVRNLSFVSALLAAKSEIFLPDGFLYSCILTGISQPEDSMETLFDVTYSFVGVRHGALKTISLPEGGGTVTCEGNLASECRLRFTPSTAATVTVFEMTLENLAAGKPVVIDGIGKVVTQDGRNIWGSTDLVGFPRLLPGENSVRISPPVPLTVEYYPIWL